MQLARIVEEAIEKALVVQASPQGLDDLAITGIALDAAESMAERFDILPKGVLREEWGVQITEKGKTVIETNPGMGGSLTREAAFYENERWKSFGYNTEGVMSRFTSDWKRATE